MASAEQELARLTERVEAMRSLLVRLLQDVVRAESPLNTSNAAQLLDANEHLVVTALDAQADAETAARALDEVSRSGELDPLTQLPHRLLLLDRLATAITAARRNGTRLALLFLDLDDFKPINDTLGHAVGDEVLKLVAQRLAASIREADTVSRHGGDEFVILLTEVSQPSDASLVAGKVLEALGAQCQVGDHGLNLTASIGISIYPDDGEDADTLMLRADAAMYHAKRHRPGGFAFHCDVPAGEQSLASPVLAAPRQRVTHDEQDALLGQVRRHAHLREANEQLVLAAVSAQELRTPPSGRGGYRRRSWTSWRTNSPTRWRPSALRRPCWDGFAATSRCCRGCRPSSRSSQCGCRAWWMTRTKGRPWAPPR